MYGIGMVFAEIFDRGPRETKWIWTSMNIDFLILKEITKSTLINLSIKVILQGIQVKQKTHTT